MGTGWSQEEAAQSREERKTDPLPQSSGTVPSSPTVPAARKTVPLPQSSGTVLSSPPVPAAKEVKLPHNYEAIIKDADTPIDTSSKEKLLEQLQAGVFLNQKRKKYWVERNSNSNSFMFFARNLSITWIEDKRFWNWLSPNETSDVLIDVAELLNVCWLEIHGNLDTVLLTPGIKYEVVFVVMMKDPAHGWEVPVNLRLTLPNGKTQQHEENLMEKPRGKWIEIPVGEFQTTPENIGEVQFSLYEYKVGKWKKGLIVKGAAIRPKN